MLLACENCAVLVKTDSFPCLSIRDVKGGQLKSADKEVDKEVPPDSWELKGPR